MNLPVPALLKWWKRLEAGLNLSAETFHALCERFQPRITQWLQQDRRAQLRREDDPNAMDIYDTTIAKGMYSGSNNCPNVWPFWKDWLGINQVNYIII